MPGITSSSSPLSEEQFLCPICLDVFTDPVSTPCGHNFCMACIRGFWDSCDQSQCPMCKRTFSKRPDLQINRSFREVSNHFKTKRGRRPEKPPTRRKRKTLRLKAVIPGLVCLVSYCFFLLLTSDPHGKVCEKHGRPLELFCRSEMKPICLLCALTEHKAHHTVPIEEESRGRKLQLEKMEAEMEQMIKQRLEKVEEIRSSVELSKAKTQREIDVSMQIFSDLLSSIERSQIEVIGVFEEKQKAAEKRAEGFIKELEQEITALKKRHTELEQLSQTEDHLQLLQTFPSLSTPPVTKDWSGISVPSDVCVGTLSSAVSQLEDTLRSEIKTFKETEWKGIRQFAVSVTLDPQTAHPNLIVCNEGKQVKLTNVRSNLRDNPKRFDMAPCVLGKEGFSSGSFYYEVQVEGKTEWDLGVARESVNRKGKITLSPQNGYMTMCLRNGDEYKANAGSTTPLFLREKPRKVGVFVDYDEGRVSFYNVEARSLIYSFTGYSFTEKLYPYFCPCVNDRGTNSTPMVITKVL